jgi:hypothetical protein
VVKVDGRRKRAMVVALIYVQGASYSIGLVAGSGSGRLIGGKRTGGSLEFRVQEMQLDGVGITIALNWCTDC